MRTVYIVCYDIADDKRLRQVFRYLRGYGDHLQFSVFECHLTAKDLVKCKAGLEAIIERREDQVLFINLGPAAGRGGADHRGAGEAVCSGGRALSDCVSEGG